MMSRKELDRRIQEFIAAGPCAGGEEEFNSLALQLFLYQYENNSTYRLLCDRTGMAPGKVDEWREIPAVPTAAFKSADLRSFPVRETVRTFRSSGTTSNTRSKHHLDTLALYKASLLPNFKEHLLPDDAHLLIFALTPPASQFPDSSLFFMIDRVMEEFGTAGSRHFTAPEGAILFDELCLALEQAMKQENPVLLLGAAFSFVHFMDACERQGRKFTLPAGSRLMETGGYKGRSRAIPKDELLQMFDGLLGIPGTHCINEYGMTELCVQFYDLSLRDASQGKTPRTFKSIPHWARVQIIDPETMLPARPGEYGIIQICDLSNRPSCIHVMTADIGRLTGDGFEVTGRAAGAEPRGCSLTVDELLRGGNRR